MEDGRGPHDGQPIITAGAPAFPGRVGAAEIAIVLLHGRGATAQGVINLFDPVYRSGVTFLAPAADRSRWFPGSHDDPIESNEPHLTSAVNSVAVACANAERIGIPPERTLIVGFSQGASVVAEYLARHPHRYGGVFILSGALPGPVDDGRTSDGRTNDGRTSDDRTNDGRTDDDRTDDDRTDDDRTDDDRTDDGRTGNSRSVDGDLHGTLVFLGCSDDDPHVSIDRVHATARVFESAGATITVDVAEGEGHAVTAASFEAIRNRLDELLDRCE